MSGWLDPLAIRALRKFLKAERSKLMRQAVYVERIAPGCRNASRCRARVVELARIEGLIGKLERPGMELLAFKSLVNMHADRHDVVDAIVPGTTRRAADGRGEQTPSTGTFDNPGSVP